MFLATESCEFKSKIILDVQLSKSFKCHCSLYYCDNGTVAFFVFKDYKVELIAKINKEFNVTV